MDIQLIKEHLSNRYIGILAANSGYVITKDEVDFGVDFQLKRVYTRPKPGGGTRFAWDGKYIDIQLKATTEAQIEDGPGWIKYDLEVKNYNDMIDRAVNPTLPLILILFILPHDRASWVEIDDTELKVRRMAYWYQPPAGAVSSENLATVRITIPKTNLLGIDCFDILHQQFYP
jgi:hypothetical protein